MSRLSARASPVAQPRSYLVAKGLGWRSSNALKTLPPKKICTHYIPPSATPTIGRLGLATATEMAVRLRDEVELFRRWGSVLPARTPLTRRPAYGYNIRRQMLDPLFRRVAVATSSVDFMPSFSARKLLINDDRINGVLAVGSDGVQREIEAGLVVGADGRQSRIAELARFDPKVKPRLNLLSLGGGVCQPFGRLEGPAAPDVPVSVEAKRRVANE